jgi:hypothetical protein
MTEPNNPKAKAWDTLGALYWGAGYNGGPVGHDIDQYLEGVGAGTKLVIVGASTRFLIGAAIERGAEVTVLDFSQRMCDALKSVVDARSCSVILHDITTPVSDALRMKYDLLLADRLINRFTEAEVVPALSNMLALLKNDGEIRTAIRLGFYARDLPIIEEGRRRGTVSQFFDPETWTINYALAGDILDMCMQPHGDIPRELLLAFYRGRGPEKRFKKEDIERYVAAASDQERRLVVTDTQSFQEVRDQVLYFMRPQ